MPGRDRTAATPTSWLVGAVVLISAALSAGMLRLGDCNACGATGVVCSDCKKGLGNSGSHAVAVDPPKDGGEPARPAGALSPGTKVESLGGTVFVFRFPTEACGRCRKGKVSLLRALL